MTERKPHENLNVRDRASLSWAYARAVGRLPKVVLQLLRHLAAALFQQTLPMAGIVAQGALSVAALAVSLVFLPIPSRRASLFGAQLSCAIFELLLAIGKAIGFKVGDIRIQLDRKYPYLEPTWRNTAYVLWRRLWWQGKTLAEVLRAKKEREAGRRRK